MNKKLIILLNIVGLNFLKLYAQQIPNLAYPSSGVISANANAQSSAGNIYTPNLFTGTVDVNIPIYNYSVDGLDLGISLGYNTGGIKVDQVASEVGLGWTLAAGGMITRQVNGIEDDIALAELDTTSTITSASGQAVPAQRGGWVEDNDGTDPPDLFTAVIGNRTIQFYMDGFSLAHPYFKIHTIPQKDILINVIINSSDIYADPWGIHSIPATTDADHSLFNSRILRFKITDEAGNQFFFDRGDYQYKNYVYTTDHPVIPHIGLGPTYFTPVTWCLVKVITYKGNIVKYTYDEDVVGYNGYRDQRVRESKNYDEEAYSSHQHHAGSMGVTNNPVEFNERRHRLTKVEYPNGDVVTLSADGLSREDIVGKAITSISIQKGDGAMISNKFTYKFNYDYFVSPTVPGVYPDPMVHKRLRLLSIDKIGTDNTTTEKYYSFGYVNINDLPDRLSGQSDCYGYYNGKPLQAAVLPPFPIYSGLQSDLSFLNIPRHEFLFFDNAGVLISAQYGRDMTPDWSYARAWSLDYIENGLGGGVNFYYKDHTLSNVPDFVDGTNTGYYENDVYSSHLTPTTGLNIPDYADANDGICISHIDTYDGFNPYNNTTTTFNFSNGLRFFPGGYFWSPDIVAADYSTPIETRYQNSFVTPIDYVHGCNHGYSNATVQTSGVDGLVKTTKYEFTNLITKTNEQVMGADNPGRSRLQVYFGSRTHMLKRKFFEKQYLGLLKKTTELNNAGDVLSETTNTYNEHRYGDSTLYIGDVEPCLVNISYTGGGVLYGAGMINAGNLTANSYPSSKVNLISSATRTYSGSTESDITTNYYYNADNDNDLNYSTSTDSKGYIVTNGNIYDGANSTIYYCYPGDTGTGCPEKTHYTKWLVGNYRQINIGGTNYFTDYSRIFLDGSGPWDATYDGVGNPVPGGGTLIKVSGYPPGVKLANLEVFHSTVPVTTNPPPSVLAKHYTQFDDHNNVLETWYNNDQKVASTFWDNRIGQKVADVENAMYDDVAYTSFEGNFAAYGTPDYNKGNWDFDPVNIEFSWPGDDAMTGRYYYWVGSSNSITSFNTTIGTKYIISFWCKGAIPSVSSALGTDVALTAQATVRYWTLYTGTFTGDGTKLGISSTASDIDELRLYPADAAMTSYTYEPLIGISSKCDERNNITYFEYDPMGRAKVVRDINNNIISLTNNVVLGTDH